MTTLKVDDLALEVRRSKRRKTLQITVDRQGELVLHAPVEASEDGLREFVQDKQFWIYKKLAEKAQLQRTIPRKEYVNGEGFLYLGKSYRLKLVDEQRVPLKLSGSYFLLHRDWLDRSRDVFVHWYTDKAQTWLSNKADDNASRMEVNPSGVKVQDLGYRWGSCGKGQCLYFHWKAILLPRHIAEYVVIHELAHLHTPHHTPAFWRRVERTLPDYERRKQWLAEHGMDVEGL